MTSPSEQDFLERASFYQTLNFRVFPVTAGGKTPVRGCRWTEQATTDWQQLTDWAESYPSANVGVVTGEVADVIDCDTHRAAVVFAQEECAYSGEDFAGAIDAIINVYGNCVTTPHGVHIYVTPTACARNTVKAQKRLPAYAAKLTDKDGIDYRGDGGYVVGAGSVRPEGEYRWRGEHIWCPAPSWLTTPEEEPKQQALPTPPSPSARPSELRERRAFETTLEAECRLLRRVQQGERHKRTLEAALRVGGLLYDQAWREEARRALVDAARATGYSRSEAETTVADGLDHASQKLRVLRDRPKEPSTPPAKVVAPAAPAASAADDGGAPEEDDSVTAGLPPHERIAEAELSQSDLLAVARHYVACDFFGAPGSWVVYSADGSWYRRDADCIWRVTSATGQGDRTLYDAVMQGLTHLRTAGDKPFPCTPEMTAKVIQALPTAAAEGGHCVPAPQETHYWTSADHPGGDWFLCPGGKLFSPWRLEFIDCPGSYWAESLELAVTPAPGDTPVWDAAFRDVGLDDAAYQRLNQICALTVYGKNSKIEKIPILYGPGGCGKTVILQLLCTLLGEVAASVSPDELAQQFNGSTATKRVIVLDDRDRSAGKVAELMLSRGGGVRRKVSLQLKHKEAVDRYISQRWLFGCNELPAIRDVGGRHQRRWWVLPFERSASVIDVHLQEKLEAEGPALLWKWAAIYAQLQVPEQIVPLPYDSELVRVIRGNSNPIAQWIEERLEPVTAGRVFCGTSQMMRDYQDWARRMGVQQTMTVQSLRSAVTEWAQGLEIEPRAVDAVTGVADRPHYTRCGNVRGWYGIGLRSRMEAQTDDNDQG